MLKCEFRTGLAGLDRGSCSGLVFLNTDCKFGQGELGPFPTSLNIDRMQAQALDSADAPNCPPHTCSKITSLAPLAEEQSAKNRIWLTWTGGVANFLDRGSGKSNFERMGHLQFCSDSSELLALLGKTDWEKMLGGACVGWLIKPVLRNWPNGTCFWTNGCVEGGNLVKSVNHQSSQ